MARFEGVYAAAITPRRPETDEINLAALWDLFDFLATHKVDGIVLMGSTGEFIHYGLEERVHIMTTAIKRSRMPVLVNVTDSTLDGSVQLAEAAIDAGAAGLLLMPPYYFRYSESDVELFFERFCREIPHDVPRLLYHLPLFTSPIPAGAAARLLESGAWDGIKDSSGDWEYFESLLAAHRRRPFTILMGNDAAFARARNSGAAGAVSGCASAIPELLMALKRSLDAGDQPRTLQLQNRVAEFVGWIDRFPVPVGIREAAAIRGIKVGPHAAGDPLGLDEFRDWFRNWLPEVQRECRNA